MRQLVLGGARSGKSKLAEQLAEKTNLSLIYIATAQVGDDEMAERVKHHQARRSDQWSLIEEPYKLGELIEQHNNADSCLLIDCLTLWLTNLLLREDESFFADQKQQLLTQLKTTQATVILVSNEVGQGIVPLGELSRQFVDESGWLHQQVAAVCDRVIYTVAGLPMILKGTPLE